MSLQLWHDRTLRLLKRRWLPQQRQDPRDRDILGYALRAVAALPVRAYLRTYHRLSIVGREHLPREGSFILISNHASHLDTLCLLSAIPLLRLQHAHPTAAEDYFYHTRRGALAAIFTNAVPFGRKIHLRRSLILCRQLLADPENILILFPEGTRTTTGRLGPFRAGIGALLAGVDVPVIPCAIQGSFDACRKGVKFPRPRRLRLIVGQPRRFANLPRGRESSARIAIELHDAVQELLCQ